MAEVGEVTIGVKFDKNSVTSGVKSLGSEVSKTGSTITSKLGGAAKTAGKAIASVLAIGAAAFATLGKAALDAYADYEQLIGGVDTLFKDSSTAVQEYANHAYQTAGLSANQYMETVTGFSARLLQGLGGDTAKAAEISNLAVTDMADNAAKMGTNMQSLQDAYQGFAKQNYEMLDNLKLGYGGTQAEMARLINDSGVLGDSMTVTAETVNSVSFDKMIEAIHVVQSELGFTGTAANEASSTVSGSLASMGAAWENVLASFGTGSDEQITQAINGLVESIGNVLQNLSVLVEPIMNGIVTLINTLAPQIPTLINMLLPPLLQGAFTLIAVAVPAIITALITPENIQSLVEAGLTLFMGLVTALPQIVTALVDALPALIDTVVAWLTDPNTILTLVGAAVQLFLALVMAVPQILGALIGAFGTLVGNLWNGITSLFGEFAGKFGDFIGGIFKGALNGVISFIENFLNGPIDLINGFIGIINGAFGFLGVNLGTISRISLPRLAEGGFAYGTTTAIIGEAGSEMVMPLERNTDAWSKPLARILMDEMEGQGGVGGGVTINQTNNINSNVDIDRIEQGLATALRRVSL